MNLIAFKIALWDVPHFADVTGATADGLVDSCLYRAGSYSSKPAIPYRWFDGNPRQPEALAPDTAEETGPHAPAFLLPADAFHVVLPSRKTDHGFRPVKQDTRHIEVMPDLSSDCRALQKKALPNQGTRQRRPKRRP
jgi:hypothetical protein